MEIQSIHRVVQNVRDDVVIKQYSQVYDEKTNKTYYECVTYTYKGALASYQDKGQNIDIRG